MLARAVPDMPCSVLLDLDEWQALYCAIHQCPTPPEEPPSLGQAVRWIAQLGGFVGRRRRDQPGTETLWRGFQHLMDLTKMYRIMRPKLCIQPKSLLNEKMCPTHRHEPGAVQALPWLCPQPALTGPATAALAGRSGTSPRRSPAGAVPVTPLGATRLRP